MNHETSMPSAYAGPPLPPPVPVVDYDTPRADQVPRRKYVGMLVVATVFAAMLLGLALYALAARRGQARVVAVTPVVTQQLAAPGPAVNAARVQAMRQSAAERRLAELVNNRLGPQTIVYEEEPVAARRLRGDSSGVVNQQAEREIAMQPFWHAFVPPAYRASGFWESGVTNESKDALLFSHTLTSPGGNSRLVMLEMEVKLAMVTAPKDEYRVAINRQLKYLVCDPAPSPRGGRVLRHGPSLKIVQGDDRNVIPIKWVDGALREARPKEQSLRFFAGQPDPSDPSHFTVEYEIFGLKDTIDGWLTDDDFLRIVPRGGKVDKGTWHIEATK
jgi:hypothetical protein